MSEKKVNGTTIAWLFGIAVFLLAIGSFGGYKYRDVQYERYRNQTITVVDSLNRLSLALRDSVRILSVQEEAQEKVIYKYRTLYDTIVEHRDLPPILDGLNEIAKTPILE